MVSNVVIEDDAILNLAVVCVCEMTLGMEVLSLARRRTGIP